MVDSLCQTYHWPLHEVMSLTVPQIIMLNHAAWVNQERVKKRVANEPTAADMRKQQEDELMNGDPIVWNGKRLSELNSDEMAIYMNSW